LSALHPPTASLIEGAPIPGKDGEPEPGAPAAKDKEVGETEKEKGAAKPAEEKA
jgi:hypothetical protein